MRARDCGQNPLDGQQGTQQAKQRRQSGDPPQSAHITPQAFRLDAVGEGDRSLKINRRTAPPSHRGQGDASGRAGVHLAVIQRLAAIELALVQAIKEPGREIGGDDLPRRSRTDRSKSTARPSPAQANRPPQHMRFRRGSLPVPAQPRPEQAAGLFAKGLQIKDFESGYDLDPRRRLLAGGSGYRLKCAAGTGAESASCPSPALARDNEKRKAEAVADPAREAIVSSLDA